MEVSGYNLSWSTFSRHLAQLSRELHTEKYFSDVTLVSDDLVQTEAHRIILSASSPLLKSLLSISPRGQTQLFLKGVKHQQLEAVLRFLYYGEVQVPSAEIREFLRAGEELEITELRNIMEKRDEKMENCEEESEPTFVRRFANRHGINLSRTTTAAGARLMVEDRASVI